MAKHDPGPTVRVASVPAAHPYVRGLGLSDVGVELLADPRPPGAPPGRWWPPVMLDPVWIADHAHRFEVLHLHFGMESFSPARLEGALDALRRAGRPLVHTVHDLSHPQLRDQHRHLTQLGLLADRAHALITLTPGAAEEIARRFARRAVVIPHPAMRTGPLPPPPAPGEASVVGAHLRDLRPGIDGPGTAVALRDAVARLRALGVAVRGRVFMHDHVRDPSAAREVRSACAEHPGLELVVAPRPPDRVLEEQLTGLAVALVPYRHGTHSGWLELCWDLGLPVAVPAVGHLADQHPDPAFCRSFPPGDGAALATALGALLSLPEADAAGEARRRARVDRDRARREDRVRIAAAHRSVYRDVIAARRS